MKKVSIFGVVALCVVALTGLLVYQSVWVNSTRVLADNQYDYRAVVSLSAMSADYSELCSTCDSSALPTGTEVNKHLLDSLLIVYLKSSGLSQSYKYNVAKVSDADSVYRIINATPDYYVIPLAYLQSGNTTAGSDSLQLQLYLLDKEEHVSKVIRGWVAIYAVFIVAIAFSLFYLVRKIMQQKRLAQEQADFIHGMIHELKTPVATIDMSSKVLKKAGISVMDYEKLRNYAEIVGEENNRIWVCVDSLLQMLTVSKRSLSLRKERVDMNGIIKAAVEGFSVATMAKPVTFELELANDIPLIMADKMHIRAVIDNIVDNAIKYSSTTGNSTIRIITERTRKNIIIIVEDRGKGIARKDQKRIFKKFYRVSGEKKRGVKGFGLGLYYVKQVVDAHEGNIYVKSKLNKGTLIGVILPIE